ncbi:ferrous iron transport protein A [archaeon]|jgi:Fe2+ transport system protein FeoA|nr:ferrous iron transport protein A [archaeon]MBT4352202.1 ferrous iron transport protein A [archaeon]MBT4647325.1 ferrous iron transport protein A [archaeon]MBT6821239.1 ferrous iron transport protein A [archaeon]MBT7391291.1 ferrous iron transport protein A [archaeon]
MCDILKLSEVDNCSNGSSLFITSISDELDSKAKLESLGFYKSSKLNIIKNEPPSPMIIRIKGSIISISRDIAHKIFVKNE